MERHHVNFFESRKFLVPFNGLGFYFLWFVIFYSVTQDQPFLSLSLCGLFLSLHLLLTKHKLYELVFMICFTVMGYLLECSFLAAGLVSYKHAYMLFPPYWIALIYLTFSTTFSMSLFWLENKRLLSTLLGFSGAMSSYFFGYKIGAASFSFEVWASIVFMSAAWAVFFPLCFIIRLRMARFFLIKP